MMTDPNTKGQSQKVDPREFEIPETVFVRDVENSVFQSIVLQCLAKIDDIGLVEGSFIDSILGRSGTEDAKGIYAEQNSQSQAVGIKVEVNVRYGVVIPDKAEEIQTKIAEEITKLTGLHVSHVHVVFRNILHDDTTKKLMSQKDATMAPSTITDHLGDEYTDEF